MLGKKGVDCRRPGFIQQAVCKRHARQWKICGNSGNPQRRDRASLFQSFHQQIAQLIRLARFVLSLPPDIFIDETLPGQCAVKIQQGVIVPFRPGRIQTGSQQPAPRRHQKPLQFDIQIRSLAEQGPKQIVSGKRCVQVAACLSLCGKQRRDAVL
ncbi:MAG TPA: hypothetical protein VEM35_00030, partial [Rhizomicrobium sp.]|nr:hypothetical protein [Rhizomicrobium sp.]